MILLSKIGIKNFLGLVLHGSSISWFSKTTLNWCRFVSFYSLSFCHWKLLCSVKLALVLLSLKLYVTSDLFSFSSLLMLIEIHVVLQNFFTHFATFIPRSRFSVQDGLLGNVHKTIRMAKFWGGSGRGRGITLCSYI